MAIIPLKYLTSFIDLRFTKDTELGENDSIKNPTPIPSNRRARKLEKGVQRSTLRLTMRIGSLS